MASVEGVSTMIGSKVSIHTNEGTYTGIVSQSSDPPSKVVLSRVACVDNGGCELRLPGLITILDVEIISFEFVNQDEEEKKVSVTKPSKTLSSNGQPQQKEENQRRNGYEPEITLQLTTEKNLTKSPPRMENDNEPTAATTSTRLNVNKRIYFDHNGSKISTKRPNSYIVIEMFGETFDEAISMIQSSIVVGFCMDGFHIGRDGQLCLMQIATKETVILFDMVALGCKEAFDSGLGQIMESTSILKIMHDCRQASDILQHKFRVRLNNVYDTQVADIMVYRKESGGYMPKYVRNLGVVLSDFMGLTQEEIDFYHIRKSALDRNPAVWKQRPLPPILLQSAALNVRYLRELRLATLEVLLADLVDGVGLYLDLVRNSNNIRSDASNGQLLPKEFLCFGPLREDRSEGRNGISSLSPTSNTNDMHTMREKYISSPLPTYDKQFLKSRPYENHTDVREGNGDDRHLTRSPKPPPQGPQPTDTSHRRSVEPTVTIDESRNVFRREGDDPIEYRRNVSNIVFYPA